MLVLYGEDVQHLVDDSALDTYIGTVLYARTTYSLVTCDVIQIHLDSYLSLQIGKSVCWMLRLESMYARVHN
jgi:hypothetical protein